MAGAEQGWDCWLRLDHVLELTDGAGIIQHATGAVPARDTGYCVDDVARLVVVAAGMHTRAGGQDPMARRLAVTGLAFLADAIGSWEANGGLGMRNFMAWDRRWLDQPHLGDHVGRSFWALGEAVAGFTDVEAIGGPALRWLRELLPVVPRLDSLHEWAYTALGLSRALEAVAAGPARAEIEAGLETCLGALEQRWQQHATDQWPWPHPELVYDNARLPQAMLAAGAALGRDELVERGQRCLDWLVQLSTGPGGVLHTIGNHWLVQGEQPGPFTGDEQPIDGGAVVEALAEAHRVTGDDHRAQAASGALHWFLGRNRLGVVLYDLVTAGCHDGLGREAVNQNQGAESTLAFLQAALAVERAGQSAPAAGREGQADRGADAGDP